MKKFIGMVLMLAVAGFSFGTPEYVLNSTNATTGRVTFSLEGIRTNLNEVTRMIGGGEIGGGDSAQVETNTAAIAAVESNAVNPNMLLDMIYTNATSIDGFESGRTPETFVEIYATSNNPALNGSNLWNAVTDLNGSGTTNIFSVDPGEYTLPSELVISGQVAHITCILSPELHSHVTAYDGGEFPNHDYLPGAPMQKPLAVINGDITIDVSAIGSALNGLKLTGDISAEVPEVDLYTATTISRCWTTGTIASNEVTCLSLDNNFFAGTVSEGTSARWSGTAADCIFLADGSLYSSWSGTAKSDSSWNSLKDCWIVAGDTFAGVLTAALSYKTAFDGCIINGEGAFEYVDARPYARARNTHFYYPNATAGVWDAFIDSSVNRFVRTDGIPNTITGQTSTVFTYCTTEDNEEF